MLSPYKLTVHRHPDSKYNFKNYISTNSQLKRYIAGQCGKIEEKCAIKAIFGCAVIPCHME